MDDGAGNGNGDHVQMVELGQLPGGDNPPQNAGAAVAGGGGGGHAPDFDANDAGTLLVVATLISGLSYQLGTNIPGGYWQDDAPGHHVAGEPIMRTQRRFQYHVFIWSSWFGFGASMGLTLALLTGVPPRSRFVRGLFVLSYSTLILSFVTQQAFSIIWVSLLVWFGVIALVTSAVNYRTHGHLRRFFDWLCREPVGQTASQF